MTEEQVMIEILRTITNPSLTGKGRIKMALEHFELLKLTAEKHEVNVSEAWQMVKHYEEANPDPTMEEPFMKESKEEEVFWDYVNELDF